MAKADLYRIVDEPVASGLERLTVNPIWPFFGTMFAGAWLAWPWFVLNALALGGGNRRVDVAIVAGGVLATFGCVIGILTFYSRGVVSEQLLPYAMLVPLGLRVTLSYVLYLRQAGTFELYQHFGGQPRNGLPIVIVGALLRSFVLGAIGSSWALALG